MVTKSMSFIKESDSYIKLTVVLIINNNKEERKREREREIYTRRTKN